MNKVSHGIRGSDVLCANLAKVIGSDLQLVQVWNVAFVGDLHSPTFCDFIHIDSQVSEVGERMRYHQEFETLVSNFINSKIQYLKIRQSLVY